MLESKIVLVNRKNLVITGIQKMINVSETTLVMEVEQSCLIVNGKEMEVKKLDVESGILEVDGKIDGVKYSDKKEKVNIIKRIFK